MKVTEAAKKYVEQLKVVEQVERSYRLNVDKEATLYHATLDYERYYLLRLREELIEAVENHVPDCPECHGSGVAYYYFGHETCRQCGGYGGQQ